MDYRKWLVFNTGLNDQQIVSDLHQTLIKKSSKGKIGFIRSSNDEGHWYIVETPGFSEQLMLPADECNDFIEYLEKHYLQGIVQPPVQKSTIVTSSIEYTDPLTTQIDSSLPSWIRNLFFDRTISRHVRGYAIAGFILVQIFILPQFFYAKLPDGVQSVFLGICLILSHFAVRNYTATFLTGGIRYKIVYRITAWLHGLLFLGIAIEIVAGDILVKSMDFTVYSAAGLGIVLVLGGLFIGWILSIIVYFSNGGKMITDPTKVNFK